MQREIQRRDNHAAGGGGFAQQHLEIGLILRFKRCAKAGQIVGVQRFAKLCKEEHSLATLPRL